MNIANNTEYLTHVIDTQARLAAANFNLDAFMQLVAEQMHKLTPATGVVVELVEDNDMVYRAVTGTVANHLGLRLPAANSISGLCVRSNEILRSNDTENDSRVNLEACRKVQARSLIVAPLIYQGKTLGVLKILSNQPNGFTERDTQTLQLMAGLIAAGLGHQILFDQLSKAKEQLKYLAHYDALTDLPNRRLFSEQLSTAMAKSKRYKTLLGVMFLDVDHFKTINDTLGHDIGDEVLKIFSSRLKQCLRQYDIVARLGGDEFVILLDQIDSADVAKTIAKKIIDKMAENFQCHERSLNITTSIGIALYRGEKLTPEELIKNADNALYEVKKSGRNSFAFASNN